MAQIVKLSVDGVESFPQSVDSAIGVVSENKMLSTVITEIKAGLNERVAATIASDTEYSNIDTWT